MPIQPIHIPVALILLHAAAFAAPRSDAQKIEFFEQRIRPVLSERCAECHGDQKQKAGLRLDSASAALKGGDEGPVIRPGDPSASKLIEAIGYGNLDLQMPPKGKLPDAVIADFKAWIQGGAVWPADPAGKPAVDSMAQRIQAMKQGHWSFQPIADPKPPVVKNAAWVANPIDAFVLAGLESRSITPSKPADKAALVRRLYFDLLGLPPTYEQVQVFVNDTSPDAYETLVDDLLSRPQYGERWARHWLDVARYADTRGYLVAGQEQRYAYAYTYRDWVVQAFNRDLPYDRFILAQLAADRLDSKGDPSDLAAMGFLTVGRRFINNNHDIIDDRIDLVSRGLMGLTMTCARCHDHKYDPVPTREYYGFYGVFNSSVEPKDLPLLDEPEKNKDYLSFEAELNRRLDAQQAGLQSLADAMMDELRAAAGAYLKSVVDQSPHRHPDAPKPNRNEMRVPVIDQWESFLKAQPNHDAVLKPWRTLWSLPKSGFAQRAAKIVASLDPQTNPLIRQALADKPPQSMHDVAEAYGALFTRAYAAWKELKAKDAKASALGDAALEQIRAVLFADNAPTTVTLDEAKGMVNRAERNKVRALEKKVEEWKVSSPAAPPRAMVMQDSERPADAKVFIRGQPGRLGEVAPRRFLSVLDSVDSRHWTAGSGRLELAQAIVHPKNPLTARVIVNRIWQWHFGEGLVRTPSDFGARGLPPTHPELLDWLASWFIHNGWSMKKLHRLILTSNTWRQSSDERSDLAAIDPENQLLWKNNRRRLDFEPLRDAMLAAAGNLDPAIGGRPVDIFKTPYVNRRTLYAFIDRGNVPGLLRSFDLPSPDASAPERPRTTVPQQTLFMMNSPFVMEQAAKIIARTEVASASDPAGKVQAIFRLALSRVPTADEARSALQYVQHSPQAQDPSGAWPRLAQALLMSNEFIFVD